MERILVAPQHRIETVRVDSSGPAVPDLLLQRTAGKIEHAPLT